MKPERAAYLAEDCDFMMAELLNEIPEHTRLEIAEELSSNHQEIVLQTLLSWNSFIRVTTPSIG